MNDLAPEHLRGRYNALSSMAWTVSMVVGPAGAGLLLGNGLPLIWLLLTVGGTAAGAGAFLHLGRRLTSSQEGLTGADQVVSTELIEAHQRTAEVSSAS